jgi:hypothetical protein
MQDGNQSYPPGTTFLAKMHWRLDEGLDIRAWAGLMVEVRRVDNDDQRLDSLSFSHPVAQVDPILLARIEALPGQYAYLPFEAAEGRTLFLKVGTLTGRNNYFFDETSDKFPQD